HVRTMAADRHGMAVPFGDGLFPRAAPCRCTGWQRHAADRLAVGLAGAPVRTADEAFPSEIDLVDTEIVDAHAVRAGADEGVEFLILEEERHAAVHLIGIIAPGDALARYRVVWLADARQKRQMHVVEREGRQD